MKIAEAAAHADLSADTIRYYEREGLLGEIARGPDGHRRFSAQNLRWLRLFERLRATAMPLAEMKRYAELARAGDTTLAARREMLERHQVRIKEQLQTIQDCSALIDEKVARYHRLEADLR